MQLLAQIILSNIVLLFEFSYDSDKMIKDDILSSESVLVGVVDKIREEGEEVIY